MAPLSLWRVRKLVEILKRPEYRRAVRHGVAAAVEHEAIPWRCTFASVIDVGANRGQFAVFASRRFPEAQLMCFEPLPQPRARLRKALRGSARLRLYDFAIADARTSAGFHVSRADDSSSLLPITARQAGAFPGTEERTMMAVAVRRLDEILGPEDLVAPVLLKIDVQGSELSVLEGAGSLLTLVHAVLVEASFVELYRGQALADDVWAFLHERGFSCLGIWALTYGESGECLQGDFLFARPGFDPLGFGAATNDAPR